jgi:hypothetical protein
MSKTPEIIMIDPSDVINLGRAPVSASKNPLFETCRIILDSNPSTSDAKAFLKKYYSSLAYVTLNDLFRTSIKSLDDLSFDNYFLPWIHKKPTSLKDPTFTKSISQSTVDKKVIELKKIMISVQDKGYRPGEHSDRRHGHIAGYFLETEKKKSFYVVAGNHRVAALSALGFEKIPVIYDHPAYFKPRDKKLFGWKEMPNVFGFENLKEWPSVKSGFLKEEEAEEILISYVHNEK